MRAPPESLMPTIGQPVFRAKSMTLTIFSPKTSPRLPPKTVKSCANTATWRPSTVPNPVTTPSPYGRFFSMPKDVDRCRASSSNSTNDPSSSSSAIRSRAVILPRACCFSTARAEPACTASSIRCCRSASLPAVVWMSTPSFVAVMDRRLDHGARHYADGVSTATGSRDAARFDMPEALRADVRLLGDALGEILREYGGEALLADVERLRELAIAAHHEVAALHGTAQAQGLLAELEFRPVLTAHPTEARRRAVVTGIRRIAELLERRDDPRLGASEEFESRRRLLEAVDVLWRTAQLRAERPGPLDEVRTAMTAFDEVLFRVVPQVYRGAETALAGDRAGASPPRVPAFVRLGSWIGGDRDGNPSVTSAVTRQAMAIQSDRVLWAIERACDRVGRGLTVDAETTPPSPAVLRLLADAEAAHPELLADLTTRSPDEPHRVVLLLAAERMSAT